MSGRSPSTSWSSQCSADAQTQRTGYAAVASSWLTAPCAHDSGPDFRRPADTLTVETRPPAAQDSFPGPWTACADRSRVPPKPCAHMPSDAVRRPYTGPRIGGLSPTSPSFVGRHRVFLWSIDTVLISIDPKLIFCPRGIIFSPFRGSRCSHRCSLRAL